MGKHQRECKPRQSKFSVQEVEDEQDNIEQVVQEERKGESGLANKEEHVKPLQKQLNKLEVEQQKSELPKRELEVNKLECPLE